MLQTYQVTPVAIVRGCYPDKFGVPRQPGLALSATAQLILQPPFDQPEALRGLEAFSHIWLTFVFHLNPPKWHALVRPPRLGGNHKIGVFASRATHRPNRLGLSLVELLDIQLTPHPMLFIRGHDVVDETPVLDIKPYLPWADSQESARAGFAPTAPSPRHVVFTPAAQQQLKGHRKGHELERLIREVLAQDPRPAYHKADGQRLYGLRLRGAEIKFQAQMEAQQLILNVIAVLGMGND